MERIRSADNPTLKLARKLLRSGRERERSGKILLDGIHLVSSYGERFGLSGVTMLIDETASDSPEIMRLVRSAPAGTRIFEIAPGPFAAISPVQTPAGIVALCERPAVAAPSAANPFLLLLDGVQDPGNLGSILRTAAATGVNQVLLSASCADPWSPRSLRGGMGAQFVLPVFTDIDPFETVSSFQGTSVATSPHAEDSLLDANLSGSVLAVFGGEGAGLTDEMTASASIAVRIPLQNSIESLNVGAAVAMFCYERLRQTTA
ncbi:MAG: hypothetical protein AMJ66_03005 [Betaproteobacteria bacterium SG8_40]|nr:MAG: hypothetical protein AMJ66_03005 [Betaproteobacteria bacterium SG8_40]